MGGSIRSPQGSLSVRHPDGSLNGHVLSTIIITKLWKHSSVARDLGAFQDELAWWTSDGSPEWIPPVDDLMGRPDHTSKRTLRWSSDASSCVHSFFRSV